MYYSYQTTLIRMKVTDIFVIIFVFLAAIFVALQGNIEPEEMPDRASNQTDLANHLFANPLLAKHLSRKVQRRRHKHREQRRKKNKRRGMRYEAKRKKNQTNQNKRYYRSKEGLLRQFFH